MRRILAATLAVAVTAVLAACTNDPTPSTNETPSAGSLPVADIYNITDTASDADIDLNIIQTSMPLGGKNLDRYLYTVAGDDAVYGAGRPIVVDAGATVRLSATNDTDTATNIHWHGMSVPNDQDGPGIVIEPGQSHDYEFVATQPGTYWYHSHERPVRDQVDEGMYAPIIVRDPIDAGYDLDQILVLDDWLVNNDTGHMEIVGDIDTVNGRTGADIAPIQISGGQIAKLRLINASSARTQQMSFPMDVRVTHTDGWPLVKPYVTRELTIAPGERFDVELAPAGGTDDTDTITNDRDNGMAIPIEYTATTAKAALSPFVAPEATALDPELLTRAADVEMTLSDSMGMGSGMTWTINGEAFPDAETFDLERGRTYVLRFTNAGMHQMDHPMHIHGAHFRLLADSSGPVTEEIWKDTVSVPPGGSVDVAITFDQPGTWMAHCHILDHEDGGMMTTINVT
jgi:FtsP/CotA-like multicopper oxidase with cupredoxin domain